MWGLRRAVKDKVSYWRVAEDGGLRTVRTAEDEFILQISCLVWTPYK